MPGKLEAVEASPASFYDTSLQVTATAGGKEPLLEVRLGDRSFLALMDSGSSASLIGDAAMAAVTAAGAGVREEQRSLRLAQGSSITTQSTRCRVHWTGESRKQRFLHLPGLCHEVVLGRDFLAAAGISLHISLRGWTLGIEPQHLIPFARHQIPKSADLPKLQHEVYYLGDLFREASDTECVPTESECGPVASDMPREEPAVDETQTEGKDHPEVVALLQKFANVFDPQPGCTSLMEHSIATDAAAPTRCRPRPVNAQKRQLMDECIEDLLEQDLIRPSTSQWACAPVLVAKKSGGYRLAVDYRPLNAKTKVPVYPMPRTDWVLAQLGNARWFTSFDLSQGFLQIPVRSEDVPKTAFVCHRGTFEFIRMPFGVAGGPATFQALMDKVLADIKHQFCMAFLDDVLIYSTSFEDHLSHIEEVLRRIAQAGLTINPNKTQMCKQSLKFLGHIISPGECRPDPDKVAAVKDFPTPQTVKELQAFLGLAGYYRTFIPRFSEVAKPLTSLLQRDAKWNWTERQQHAFGSLRCLLADNVVVALPDLNRPFVVETDASAVGVAAVLLQETGGQLRPVSFISRTLKEAEQHYTVQEWECLAVVWAVDKFRPYLEHTLFEIHTDHASLKWMFTTEQTSSRVRRWVLRLQGFNCVVKHRRGRANIPADALSRNPVSPVAVAGTSALEEGKEEWFPIDVREPDHQIRFEETALVQDLDITQLNDSTELAKEQRRDPQLAKVIRYLQEGTLPANRAEARQVQCLAEESELQPPGGLLHQVAGERPLVWIPLQLRQTVLKLYHDHPLSGHLGYFKTLRRIQERFTWLGMRSDISRYVRSCRSCQMLKPRRRKPGGMMDSTWAVEPMAELSVDLIGPLPRTPRQHRHLLVVVDKFTKFVELYPLRSPTSKVILERMLEVFCRHGFPKSISSDNGRVFVSNLWKAVMRHLGIKDRHTVPYRPAGQLVERHNATVKQCLMAYCSAHKDWDQRIPEVAFAMRTCESVSTGYTPALLCYGRELRMPGEADCGKTSEAESCSAAPAYVADLASRIQDAQSFAREHQEKAQELQRKYYDQHRQPVEYDVGDVVLRDLHTLSDASKGIAAKLAARRSGPYVITQRVGRNDYQLKDRQTGRPAGIAHADQLVAYHDEWT